MTQALHIRDLAHSEEDPLTHLPPPDARHWLPRHKAAVVAAVRAKALTFEEARQRYMLTEEEFCSWKEAIDRSGLMGLQASPRERRRAPRKSISEPGAAAFSSDTLVDLCDHQHQRRRRPPAVPHGPFIADGVRTALQEEWAFLVGQFGLAEQQDCRRPLQQSDPATVDDQDWAWRLAAGQATNGGHREDRKGLGRTA